MAVSEMDKSLPDRNKVRMLHKLRQCWLMCVAAALAPANLYFAKRRQGIKALLAVKACMPLTQFLSLKWCLW